MEPLADLIRDHYLFVDRAESLAQQVEAWAKDPIAELDSPEELADALTQRLRDATGDGHFRVMARVFTPAELTANPEDRWKHSMPGPASNFGFRAVEVTDATALITLDSLDYIEWSRPTAMAAMEFARHAERVVIDLRGCRGGDPELIAFIAGYFTGPAPIELGTVHWRDGTTETLFSDPAHASFHFDPDVDLVVVVGPETASGGEALADHLQAPGRALVVGQPSIGAAHRIKEFQLTDELVARIPSGYVVNAFSGTDWEGTGVTPDVLVEPDADSIHVARTTMARSRGPRTHHNG
ncbi:MAG: S41 family peptidase [Actinomycetota bacterium]